MQCSEWREPSKVTIIKCEQNRLIHLPRARTLFSVKLQSTLAVHKVHWMSLPSEVRCSILLLLLLSIFFFSVSLVRSTVQRKLYVCVDVVRYRIDNITIYGGGEETNWRRTHKITLCTVYRIPCETSSIMRRTSLLSLEQQWCEQRHE